MEAESIIVVADLGSSQLRLVAATKEESGKTINILGIETVENSNQFISRGDILQSSELGSNINRMTKLLNNRLGAYHNVRSLYLAYDGMNLRSKKISYVKPFGTQVRLTDIELSSLKNEALAELRNNEKEIVSIIPQGYVVDDIAEQDPAGLRCNKIEVEYLVVYYANSVKDNFNMFFDRATALRVNAVRPAIEMSAKVLLDRDQRNDGVMLMDMGDATTSFIIIKNNIIRNITVVPFGKDNIVKDIIKEFGITRVFAEQLLLGRLAAVADDAKENTVFTNTNDGSKVKYTDLIKVMTARLDEIMGICKYEVEKMGYLNALPAGLVITGGASNITSMSSYLSTFFDMTVQKASLNNDITLKGKDAGESIASIIGIVLEENKACVEVNEPEPIIEEEEEPKMQAPTERKKSKADKAKQGGLFGTLAKMFDDEKSMD